ncbi:MAG: hypothetical protein P8Y78_05625 [Acidihalobacter sp.]
MTISGLGTNASLYQGTQQTVAARRENNFRQLGQALQSGNLGAAQQAFASFLQTFSGAQAAANSAQANNGTGSTSPLGALTQALQSGNLGAAQQAFAALQSPQQQPQAAGAQQGAGGSDGDGDGSSMHVTA